MAFLIEYHESASRFVHHSMLIDNDQYVFEESLSIKEYFSMNIYSYADETSEICIS